MKNPGVRGFHLGLVAVAIAACIAADANAFSRGSRGSRGSYASAGSYASYGSAGSYAASYGSYGSYGASYGSAGSRGGLFARWHARKAARKASHGSYGSYGSHASYASAGSYASYGSSGSYAVVYSAPASAGSHGSSHYGAPVEHGAPAEYSAPAEPAVPEEADPAASSANAATIHASVPADAKIYVNGKRTTSTGAERSFVSNGLTGGKSYTYQVRIEYKLDGKDRVENKLVRLQAGGSARITAGDAKVSVAVQEPVKTELKVRVPAEAKVFLAGTATSQTGEERVYASSRLKAGQHWNGYTVRVELQRDGQTLVKERTLDITGGQTYDLAFDFEQQVDQLASLD